MDTRVLYYIICILLLIFIIKPSIIFKPDGKIREFGLGYDDSNNKKTLFNIQFILLLVVIFTKKLMKNK